MVSNIMLYMGECVSESDTHKVGFVSMRFFFLFKICSVCVCSCVCVWQNKLSAAKNRIQEKNMLPLRLFLFVCKFMLKISLFLASFWSRSSCQNLKSNLKDREKNMAIHKVDSRIKRHAIALL